MVLEAWNLEPGMLGCLLHWGVMTWPTLQVLPIICVGWTTVVMHADIYDRPDCRVRLTGVWGTVTRCAVSSCVHVHRCAMWTSWKRW